MNFTSTVFTLLKSFPGRRQIATSLAVRCMKLQIALFHTKGSSRQRREYSCRKFFIMTLHIFLLLPLITRFWKVLQLFRALFLVQLIVIMKPSLFRCFGQENPCEGISLGSCLVEPGSIINTLSFPPDKCAKFCQLDNNCEFWRARWDGTECHLLRSDYQLVSSSIISDYFANLVLPGLWIICWTYQLERLHWGFRLLLRLCWGWLCVQRRENRWGRGGELVVGGWWWWRGKMGGNQVRMRMSWPRVDLPDIDNILFKPTTLIREGWAHPWQHCKHRGM